MLRRAAALVALVSLVAACTDRDGDDTGAPTTEVGTTATTVTSAATVAGPTGSVTLGPGGRPAELVAPPDVVAPAPLVVLLHGYTATGATQDAYLGITEQAASRGLYVLLPDGTIDQRGNRFWDATGACCNFTGTSVDDVGYLRSLIEEAIEERPIDPARVYVLGHSNGGFMAYRLACEVPELVTAIAVLAGSDVEGDEDCVPDGPPVSVLHLHGDADQVIPYEGGRTTAPFPGAVAVVARWAARAGCGPEPVDGGRLDLDRAVDGAETVVHAYGGCGRGLAVQLDTLEGSVHTPPLEHEKVGTEVLDWLLARTR